tara:strand:+ start:605 stop:2032 length:1428 start_codon:yes stop_codon:yes gene_type:complete
MADRIPLILNTSANQIQELASGDNLDITGCNIVGGTLAGVNTTGTTTLSHINVSGVATVAGNLSVGGILTYEDVTNVDSVGIVTARAGLKVTGGTSYFAGAIAAAGAITGTASTATLATTATTSTNITVADESSDTTCFPTFVTAATGNLPPKTGSNLAFNSSSGRLTATSFAGDGSNLTGISVNPSTGDTYVKLRGATGPSDSGTNTFAGSGAGAALNGSSGDHNTFFGRSAGGANDTGTNNVFLGSNAGLSNVSGSLSVVVGMQAFEHGTGGENTVIGGRAARTSSFSGTNNIIIGHTAEPTTASTSNEITLGNSSVNKFRVPGIGCSITSQSLTAKGLTIGPGVLAEKLHVDSGGGIQSNYTHSVLTYGMIWYGSTNAAGSWTFNVQGDGSTTLNSLMNIGETTTMTMYSANNNTARHMTAFKIDGTTITVKWAGGSAPSASTGSGTDVYSMTIMKTANATFTVFGNFTNFA